MNMSMTRRTATNWRIVKIATTWKVVAYFAATTRRIVTYDAGMGIPAR